MDKFVGEGVGKPSKPELQRGAPKPGTRYNPPPAETATNRDASTPGSKSPSTYGTSFDLSSKQSGRSQANSSSNSKNVHESLAKDWGKET